MNSGRSCITGIICILAISTLGNCQHTGPERIFDSIEICADRRKEYLCPAGFIHVLYAEYRCCSTPSTTVGPSCCCATNTSIGGSASQFSKKVMGYSNVTGPFPSRDVCNHGNRDKIPFFRSKISCVDRQAVIDSCSRTSEWQQEGYLSSRNYYSRTTPSPSSAEQAGDKCRCTLAPQGNHTLNVTVLRIFTNGHTLTIGTRPFSENGNFDPGTSKGNGFTPNWRVETEKTVEVMGNETPDLQFLIHFTSSANVSVECGTYPTGPSTAGIPGTTVTPNTGTSSAPTTIDDPGQDDIMTVNNAAAIGAGVGATLVVLLVLIGGVLLFFRYRRAKLEAAREEQAPPTSDYVTYDYINDKARHGHAGPDNSGGSPGDIQYEEVEMNGGKSVASPDDIIFDAGLEVSPNALYGPGQRDVTAYIVPDGPESRLYETVDDEPPQPPGTVAPLAQDELQYEYVSEGAGPVPGMEVEANSLYGGGGDGAAQLRTDL